MVELRRFLYDPMTDRPISGNNDLFGRRVERRSILRSIGGVVFGATLAAGAGSTRAAKQSLPNEISITKDEGGIEDGTAEYQFAVSTDLEGTSAEAGEVVDGNHADGRVGPTRGTDTFRFAGSIVDFDLEGDAAVYLNGEQVDPAVLHNTVHIQSTAEDRAFYEIAVDGQILAGAEADLSGATNPDSITQQTASGSVASKGVDTYHFAGELTRLSVEQPTVVRVNSDIIEELPNTLTIESTAEERATYEVAAAGRIGAGLDADLAGATHPDTLSGGDGDFVAERGTEASGSVASGGTDSYRFSKDITDLTVDGPADVYVNGEQVEELPDTLTIESTAEERASYEVSIDGRIEAGSEADLTGATHPDTIDGNMASGSVAGGGIDDYRIAGEVTDLDVDGPARTYLNGEPIQSPPDGSDDEPGIVEQCGDTTLRVIETAQFVNYDANETDVDFKVVNEGDTVAENVIVEIVAESPDEAITTTVDLGTIDPGATKVRTGTVPGTHDEGEAAPNGVSCDSEE